MIKWSFATFRHSGCRSWPGSRHHGTLSCTGLYHSGPGKTMESTAFPSPKKEGGRAPYPSCATWSLRSDYIHPFLPFPYVFPYCCSKIGTTVSHLVSLVLVKTSWYVNCCSSYCLYRKTITGASYLVAIFLCLLSTNVLKDSCMSSDNVISICQI